jgi:hypothetical protein
VRFAQTANVGYAPNSKMPRTFMATAVDLGAYEGGCGRDMYVSLHNTMSRHATSRHVTSRRVTSATSRHIAPHDACHHTSSSVSTSVHSCNGALYRSNCRSCFALPASAAHALLVFFCLFAVEPRPAPRHTPAAVTIPHSNRRLSPTRIGV